MIFLTLILGWWEYDESKFQEIFDNSWNRPIYAICYSQHCPHCVGIPSRFKMFSQTMANNDNIIYTAIDTGNSTACQKLGAKYVPYFVFARGTNKKYWLRPQFNCPLRWMEFVSDWGSPKVATIKDSKDELENHVKKTLNGGSTFYLQSPKSDKIFEVFSDLSTKYHIFNDTFVFSESDANPKLTVFTSTKCSHQFDVDESSIIKYVKDYRFSSLHHLDIKEWTKLSRSKLNPVILMNDGELNGTRLKILDELANSHCDDARFGWGIIKDEKAISAKLQQKTEKPYLASINRKNDCQFIQEFEFNESFEFLNEFIQNSFKGPKGKEKCQVYVAAEKPKEKKEAKKIDSKKIDKKVDLNEEKFLNNIENSNDQSRKFSIKIIAIIAAFAVSVIIGISYFSYKSNSGQDSDVESKIE